MAGIERQGRAREISAGGLSDHLLSVENIAMHKTMSADRVNYVWIRAALGKLYQRIRARFFTKGKREEKTSAEYRCTAVCD